MVTVLDQNENKINSLKINLGKLEDNYHRENMEIEDKLYSLEDKKNELETYLQEVYAETSHLLRQNDSDGSTFMSLNRIIESYQMELIDEYENYKQTIIVQEENSRTQFLKDRVKLENDISSLEGRKYY
ncbi:hypothetical protein HMPREF2771_09410 [Streptococcus sp. HMSC072E12]|uniref:hypothetical protein n=1 Tax=Streptococcus sp. HMSC072E12 TaxID=1739275 RepID=UPI0008A5AB78|nr:hypothetical protein [Streptococcus sp. HMSC072E12]OFL34610.1 hypothetical protein HMPREF2771_09410 [Streptococcus sp. HMSC072E12]